MIIDYLEDLLNRCQDNTSFYAAKVNKVLDRFAKFIGVMEYTLEDTLIEKIGGGPHGYGDPDDMTIRDEETFLVPHMIWRKVRYEKCFSFIDKYYACVQENEDSFSQKCRKEETAMFDCKRNFYSPEKQVEVEEECISEYIKLRSAFRRTGSDDDLWKMKMLLIHPGYDKLRQIYKENESYENMRNKKSKSTNSSQRVENSKQTPNS